MANSLNLSTHLKEMDFLIKLNKEGAPIKSMKGSNEIRQILQEELALKKKEKATDTQQSEQSKPLT